MRFPATMATFKNVLSEAHSLYQAAVATDGELSLTAEQAKVAATALLSMNVPLSALAGHLDEVVAALSKTLVHPGAFGHFTCSASIPLVHPVECFKTTCKSLADALQYGIIGLFAALTGEDVLFVSPDMDKPLSGSYVDWDIPNRYYMRWALPHLKSREMHLNTPSRGNNIPSFDDGGSDVDADPRLTSDVKYIGDMLYRNAVKKFLKSLKLCPSSGYAVQLLCGQVCPSTYYEEDPDDFLPREMVERMNTIMHFDPPNGYIEKDGSSYESYHSTMAGLPPFETLCGGRVRLSSDIAATALTQLEAYYSESTKTGVSNDKKWIIFYVPSTVRAVKDASRIAIEFSLQHLFKVAGAVTTGVRGKYKWAKNYVDLSRSYAMLLHDKLGVQSVAVENGAYQAYLARFVVSQDTEGSPVGASYTVFADRGFLKDATTLLGNPVITVDDKKYKISYTYTSEWSPVGPGLRAGDLDVGADPTTATNNALEPALGTASRYSPYAAFVVTIDELPKEAT